MTREEVIKSLQDLNDNYFIWGATEYREALNTAIELLEKDGRKTNLEHYALNWKFDEDGKIVLAFDKSFSKFYKDHSIYTVCELLLEPYEEQPKYKLSRFEYDLLECYNGICDRCSCITELWLLDGMLEKGYFKDVPSDVPIKDILDDCEVVEE